MTQDKMLTLLGMLAESVGRKLEECVQPGCVEGKWPDGDGCPTCQGTAYVITKPAWL